MSESKENIEKPEPDESGNNPERVQDLLGALDFIPGWAKDDASSGTQIHKRFEDTSRGERTRGRGKRGEPRRGGGRGGDYASAKRDGGRSGRSDRRSEKPRRGERNFPRRETPRLPVDVSFIPERDRLGSVVKLLHALKKAFPLPYVANLFLTKPEYYLVKLEVKDGEAGNDLQFFQCKKSRAVFTSENELLDYIRQTYLENHFERIDIEMEPPSGNFVCVGRCRRSGEIVGPPNYHGYSERMAELHRSRFSHLSISDYRNQIEMVREPEVIEAWKESCRKKSMYRPIGDEQAEPGLTRMQAEKLFDQQFASDYIQKNTKAILPATMIREITNHALLETIRAARAREERFPLSMMLALRPAFRRMKLQIVKTGKNESYVLHAAPKPLDAEHAISAIKKTVEIITAKPGCTRETLLSELHPGKPLDDKGVVELLESLTWLIDKGHIIEFFNGTFAIPGHLRDPGVVPREQPQAHHHVEVKKAASPAAKITEKSRDEPDVSVPEESAVPVENQQVAMTEAPETAEETAEAVPDENAEGAESVKPEPAD